MPDKDVNMKTPMYTSGKPVGNPAGPKGGKSPADPLGILKAGGGK